MKKEVIEEMENFSIRVLKGENATPQETAVLPEILEILDRKTAGRGEL